MSKSKIVIMCIIIISSFLSVPPSGTVQNEELPLLDDFELTQQEINATPPLISFTIYPRQFARWQSDIPINKSYVALSISLHGEKKWDTDNDNGFGLTVYRQSYLIFHEWWDAEPVRFATDWVDGHTVILPVPLVDFFIIFVYNANIYPLRCNLFLVEDFEW